MCSQNLLPRKNVNPRSPFAPPGDPLTSRITAASLILQVFASLLEYAAVGYLGKRVAMRKSRAQQLAKLAEQARQERARQAAAQEAAQSQHPEPPMPSMPTSMGGMVGGPQSPDQALLPPLVKGFGGGCPTCPTMMQSQPQHMPPCFTMVSPSSSHSRLELFTWAQGISVFHSLASERFL